MDGRTLAPSLIRHNEMCDQQTTVVAKDAAMQDTLQVLLILPLTAFGLKPLKRER